jgi:hypothetical protein
MGTLDKPQGPGTAGPWHRKAIAEGHEMARVQDYPDDNATGWATILVPPTLVKALDRYIAEEASNMSRPEAMCRALQNWCTEMGYLPSKDMNADSN